MNSSYKIQLVKTIKSVVTHGTIELIKEEDSYKVVYHNRLYMNSPFECPTTFSTSFNFKEIVNSPEVMKFISSITGEIHEPID